MAKIKSFSESKLLSIYIPTYNRSNCLKQLLEMIQVEIDSLTVEDRINIEIVVSDNASSDSTALVLLNAKMKKVVDIVIRQGKNLGLDKNMLAAGSLTSGRYIWILCDDDLPSLGSFQKVLSLLVDFPNAGLFYLNRTKEEMNGLITSKSGIDSVSSFGLMDAREVLFNVDKELITASCLMFRREACNGCFTVKYGDGRLTSPLAYAIDALVLTGYGYVSEYPLIRYRHGENVWFELWPWVWTVSIPRMFQEAELVLSKGGSYRKTQWHKIDEKKAKAVLVMIFRKASHPPIISDWFWIIKYLLFRVDFFKYSATILFKKLFSN